MPAAERVWKGLSRTFQVSTISRASPRSRPWCWRFAGANGCCAIHPACCRGAGPRRRRPGNFCSVLDCPALRIARWVNWPWPAAVDRNRPGSGGAPKSCCWTNRRPAFRRRIAGAVLRDRKSAADVAVLFIEHDMELVFRFAENNGSCRRRVVSERAYRRRSPPIPMCAGSIWATTMTSKPVLLHVESLCAGYGDSIIIEDIGFFSRSRLVLGAAGPQWRRKVDLVAYAAWACAPAQRRYPIQRMRHQRNDALCAHLAGAGMGTAGTADVSKPDGRGASGDCGPQRRLDV